MPTNMFDEARRRVSSGTNASSTQNDNIFSQARSRVNTGQTVDTVPAITQRSAASPLPTRKKNLERIDLGQNEVKIGEGWENRVNTEDLIGESYKDTTAYYDRMLKQKKQQFEAVKPDSNFLQERQRIRNEIDRLEQEREAIDASGKRGSFRKEGAGGFGSDSELHINPRSTMQTVADTIARGAGQFDLGLLKTADFAANAIPNAAGAIRGVDPEETFTGQLFKPITDATGQAVDWMQRGVENMNRSIQNDTKGNKAAQIAAEVGSGVVGAIPNAALAMMTGGASAGGAIGSQLAPQATGLSGTILSAWNKMVSSPMFQVSFAQTLGNSYDEAKQAGASDVDAMAAALLSTTANAMVEVGGGIETLPGEISGADLSSGKKALKWLTSALDEGKEEVVQGVISNMVNKTAGTENRPYFSMTDENAVLNPYRMGQEFAMGTAVGGIMGGGQVLADTVMNRSKAGKSALDFAIEETLKPTQEQTNLDRALEGLFEKNKTAQADTRAESTNVNTNPAVHTPHEQSADAIPTGMDGNSDMMDHGAVGAAEIGFSPYSHYQNQTDNFLPEGANAARPVDIPAVDPTGRPVRRGAKTIYGAQTTSDARAEQMENEFMEGLYGYDPVRDKPTLEKAKYTLEQEGYDRAYARVTERLQSMKKLKETGLEAYLLYADAVKNGKDADAADLCLLLTQSGTEFAQGVQLFSMFRKLTPEGQLMGVERLVQRINNKYAGSDKETSIPDYARNDVIREITDVRDTALRLLENIQAVFDKTGQNNGVPVEDWIQEIGDRLSKYLEKTSENSSQLTVSKTIQNDLRRFAKSYFDRKKPGNRYSNAQALENFLNNRDQYTEAWDEARWYLSNKYKNDPSMLDALNDFLTSGINIESIGSGIDTDIKKAMNDIGVKTKDIIRKSNADKDSTAKQIAEMLMKDHNLSNEDADTMANFIIDRFNQHISDASELVLKNRFSPKDKKAKKTFEQDFYELANMGAFTNENWKDAVSKKLFGHEISIDETLISEFLNSQDQDTRDAVMEKIYENIGKQIPTTASEAINQFRYTAMLLNPSTHIKNMGGNLSMMAMKLGKDAVGAGIETVANAVTGGKVGRTKSILNIFNKSDQALMQKAWSDFENVQDDAAGIGKNKDNVMGKVGEYRDYWKLNDPQGSAAKMVDGALRTAEKVPKFNNALMNAEDMIFSRPDYAVSLAGYMKANKLTEITPEARAYAIKEAQKATFRDANAVSNFARKMGTGDHKFWNWVANAIFPFKGTPANVGVRAFEYSPAGLLKALTYDIYRVKKGKITATEYIDNLSSGLTGSALAVVGYFLAQAGFLRSTGVGDEKEKEQQRQQGYKDNSFTLFGRSIPENVFTSASAPMFVGAAFYEAIQSKALTGEIYGWDEVLQVLAATADPIFGQTMLDGLSDTFYAIRSAQGGIGETMASLGINTVGNYLSSFMPTILSRISSAADSAGRETYVDKNKQMKGIQKEVQDLMLKSPARQLLHEKVDNYGRVQETWKPFGDDNAAKKALNFAANVVTPTYPSEIKTTPVEDELNRLYRSGADTSDKKIFQTEAAKSFKVDGKTINLSAEQHDEFEKIRGENTMEYQGALQGNDIYGKLDDTLKINATDKMYDFIEQTSKESLDIGYEPEEWVSELKGKSQEEIADAIMLKTMESIVGNKKVYDNKYDGMADLLEKNKLDDAIAITMMPETMQTAYRDIAEKGGVSVQDWLDTYAYAYANGKTNAERRSAALDYIDKQNLSKSQKTALANGLYSYLKDMIPKEAEVSDYWLLDQGASGLQTIEANMSDTQKENYYAYIKNSGVDMKYYLDAWDFKGTAKSDKDKDGNTTKSAMEKVIEHIDQFDASKEEKRNIFLGLGYAKKNIPWWWK